jgi:hypothetical protein
MVSVSEIRTAQRAEGPATILAIGTANPANCVEQSTYPDFYFKITNSEHKTELKEKFQRMCKYFFFLYLRYFPFKYILLSLHWFRVTQVC